VAPAADILVDLRLAQVERFAGLRDDFYVDVDGPDAAEAVRLDRREAGRTPTRRLGGKTMMAIQ